MGFWSWLTRKTAPTQAVATPKQGVKLNHYACAGCGKVVGHYTDGRTHSRHQCKIEEVLANHTEVVVNAAE
jgi:hypothetical protein